MTFLGGIVLSVLSVPRVLLTQATYVWPVMSVARALIGDFYIADYNTRAALFVLVLLLAFGSVRALSGSTYYKNIAYGSLIILQPHSVP